MPPQSTTIGSGPIKLAVLDDYASLSPPYFQSLPKDILTQLEITIYTQNILHELSNANTAQSHRQESSSTKVASTFDGLASELQPYSVICTMRERTAFPASLISRLPNLRYLLTTGLRNAALDLPAFKAHSIIVSGTAGPPTQPGWISATTQHTWALVLALASNIPRDHSSTQAGGWLQDLPLNTYLSGKTFGALGLGRLGAEAAKIAVGAWGMKFLAWSENLTQEKADEVAKGHGYPAGTYQVAGSKREFFSSADVVSVHLVLGDRSRGTVGQEELGWMKSTALLVNTSRGPIVDEGALLDTLENGRIRGAAVDVFDPEPLPLNSPWRTTSWGKDGRSQVIITPHAGYNYEETMDSFWKALTRNVERYVNGEDIENRLV